MSVVNFDSGEGEGSMLVQLGHKGLKDMEESCGYERHRGALPEVRKLDKISRTQR